MRKTKGKSKYPDHGHGLLAAVDIVIENTMAQHYRDDLTKHEIADLCEQFLPDDWINRVIANALPNAIGARLRAAKLLDLQGNEIRRFGSYKVAFVDDGREKLFDCWKAWKHMSDGQMHQAVQSQITRATYHNRAVKSLVAYLNTEVRRAKGWKPLHLKWDNLKDSLS